MGKKQRLLTGDRASGNSYVIGAYIGTIKSRIECQDDYDVFIFSADYHTLTTHYNQADIIHQNAIELIKTQLSIGIDPERATFYRQSRLPQTFRLHLILSMLTPMVELERQPALKEKLQGGHDLTYGLLGYPVLMAADILIVDSDVVPVAKDQEAHIEITRDLANKFNKTYGKGLKVPKGLIGDVLVGLDGQGKSGKSTGGIFFNDSSEDVRKKVMGMYTDPNRIHPTDPGRVEGNPVFTYHDYFNENSAEVNDLKERYLVGKVGDVEVKEKLYAAIEAFLSPIRERRAAIDKKGDDYIMDMLLTGEKKAGKAADDVIERVMELMKI